jgi:uncharacterized membrane protein (UPF0127 family)
VKTKLLLGVYAILISSLIIFAFLFYSSNQERGYNEDPINSIIQNQETKKLNFERLEIADSDNERSNGYKNRTEICDRCGMLFVFPYQLPLSFWMQDTPTSLDIIFIDDQGTIINIYTKTVPFQTEPKYQSGSPAKYVLELKANGSQLFELKEGDKIDIEHLINQGIEYRFSS